MKSLLLLLLSISFSSGTRYEIVPQTYYLNPAGSYLNNYYGGGYINPASTASLFGTGQTAGLYNPYAPTYPYSPALLYAPGINSQWLNPTGSQEQVASIAAKKIGPSSLTKSHVQYNPQNKLNTAPLSTFGLVYPNYLQQNSFARSLCSTCSCLADYGCSFNCEKCSALCHSCSCEESEGCSYNCDKCQDNGSRDVASDQGFTTNAPDDDISDPVTSAAEPENVDGQTDSEVAATDAPVTEESSGDDTDESTGEDVTEAANVENVTNDSEDDTATTEAAMETTASAVESTDSNVDTTEGDGAGTESVDAAETTPFPGLINPTFPLSTVSETENNGLVNPTFPLGGAIPLGEAGVGTTGGGAVDGAGVNSTVPVVDCSPLETLDLCSWGPSCQTVVNEVYPSCNYNCSSCAINQPGTCISSSGSAAGQQCIFPFKYNGVQYNGCAPLHSENRLLDFWCSTKTDVNGFHITGPFEDPGKYVGFCDSSCIRDITGFRIAV